MRKGGAKRKTLKKSVKTKRVVKKHTARIEKTLQGIFGKKIKFTQKLKTLLEKDDSDYEKYSKILNTFQRFFYSILRAEELAIANEDERKLSDIDMVKSNIDEILESIDAANGNLYDRIHKWSPDVFKELEEYLQPSYETTIALYEDVIRSLKDMYVDVDVDYIHSDVSLVQANLTDDLIKAFTKKREHKNNLNGSLVDMFKGLTVEKDISDIFSSLKI
jgi:predicted RND superfamily exporter protein